MISGYSMDDYGRPKFSLLITTFFFVLRLVSFDFRLIYVKHNTNQEISDGSEANPFVNLKDAIDDASSDDEIIILGDLILGTDESFIGKNLTIR